MIIISLMFFLFLGDYSLEISPVTLEDDAVFQCQVGAIEGGVSGIRSRSARFTVQVPPESPVIIVTHAHSHAQVYKSSSSSTTNDEQVDSSMFTVSSTSFESSSDDQSINNNQKSTMNDNDHNLRTTAGMTIELTCEAHGGRPPAEVSALFVTNTFSFHKPKLLRIELELNG